MFQNLLVIVPFGYTIRRYYFNLFSFLKFLILEFGAIFLSIFYLSDSFFSFFVNFLLFYVFYELGYYHNDTADINFVRRRIDSIFLNKFRKYIYLRFIFLIFVLPFVSANSLAIAGLALFFFILFNYTQSYIVRAFLLFFMGASRFLCVADIPLNGSFNDKYLIFYLCVIVFLSQKVLQYLMVKVNEFNCYKYHIASAWLFFTIQLNYSFFSIALVYVSIVSIIYWFLFFRLNFNKYTY